MTTRCKVGVHPVHHSNPVDNPLDRLLSYYNPALHRLLGNVLRFFAKPRETPLSDDFILGSSAESDPAPFTLLDRLNTQKLDRIDIAAECLDHMAAGIDTTGDGLCFLMWELSQPSSAHYQERLRDELLSNPEVALEKLPLLDAVVMEGLRCFPPIPMSLPRHVPRGGRSIDGFFIPEGTIVSCQAYSVHRVDSSAFPDPDVFRPERWLEAEGDSERRRLFFAFANGGRGCIGKHLALAEMKTLLRAVYSQFRTVPDGIMGPDDMEMADQLISSRPRGEKCLLKFEPVGR